MAPARPRVETGAAPRFRLIGEVKGQGVVDVHLREGSGSGFTVKPKISAGSEAENVPPDEFPNRDTEAPPGLRTLALMRPFLDSTAGFVDLGFGALSHEFHPAPTSGYHSEQRPGA